MFLKVKDWPWWGLLASLRPLLSSMLSTEQLRAKEVGSVLWVVTCWYPALGALVSTDRQLSGPPLLVGFRQLRLCSPKRSCSVGCWLIVPVTLRLNGLV